MTWFMWLIVAGLLLAVRYLTEPFIRFVRRFAESHGVEVGEPEPALPLDETTGPNKLGSAAFTTGVVALALFIFPPATIAVGVAAIIMGFVAWRRPEEKTSSNRGKARSGMELGIFAIPWGMFWWDIINQINQNPP